MRRYTILFLTAFMLVLSAVAGTSYRVGADERISELQLTAYTTLPAETVTILSEAYEKENHVRVNFVPLPAKDLIQKTADDSVSDPTVVETVDVILAESSVLNSLANKKLLISHASEVNDAVKNNFKDKHDRWIGVWYDPVVFCTNKDFLSTLREIPDTWTELANFPNVRIGITDFIVADAASNLMFQMIGNFGDAETYKILRGLHPKVVQYTKFLSNPVRQAGMGETDISIAVGSETIRYMQEGYPLKIIYPADGTSYILTGVALSTKNSSKSSEAKKFSDWLLSDNAQLALQRNGFYFISTNPNSLAYKSFAGKNLVLFKNSPEFTEQQQHNFLERWVKHVRFRD
ncbi:MAG: extracellular solute-binding protein [Selenomonadaceae bacterium]|nr:extracellular solute-binding protein [Selenomonadaceae bacterium]